VLSHRFRNHLVLPLFTLLGACALGGPRPVLEPLAGSGPLPLDTAVVQGELPNGLRYFIRPNAEPRSRAELRLVVRVGSIVEDDDQLGLAHVVEHMAFNGTENFARQELVDYLERVGMRFGPDLNAYTSFDETVYMLTVPTDAPGVLETGIRILEEWAARITFDPEEVEKERGVVIEEWRAAQGAGTRVQDRHFPKLVGVGRYSERMPIGTLESLRTFDVEALRRFYQEWYRPDLMAVVAVGDFDPVAVEALIRERFAALENPAPSRPRAVHEIASHPRTEVSAVGDPEATGSSISVYLKSEPFVWTDVSSYRQWLVESLASGMLTNRISERLYLPESPFLDVSSFHGRFLRPLTVYSVTVRVPDGGVKRGLEELLLEMSSAQRHGFAPTELEREKQVVARRMEQRYLERAQTTSGSYASDYVAAFAYGGALLSLEGEYELHRMLLPRITAGEVNGAAQRWMGEEDRVVLVTAPQLDGAVPEEEELRAVLASIPGREVLAYADRVSSADLLGYTPVAGRVVSERHAPEVGVTEWRLSNGVRLLLKPTDFRQDEVLLAGRSPGGTSLVDEDDYFAAVTAPAVVQAGGLGELSVTELTKYLAGRMVGVGTDISETAEHISGGGSRQDLDMLFRLVYLKFMAPRLDSAAVEAYRTMAVANLANRSASPEQVFMDTLRAVLTQYHPRTRPLASSDFERLDMRRSLEIYRERFGDASDFTFYLVGAFDLEEVRPLAERYLGSLPALGRSEQARDLGIRPPAGIVERTVLRGVEPKALTQIVFTGPVEFARETLYTLNAVAEVLQLRLRETLREDLGGTYGVQVSAGASREPYSRYQLSIGFGTSPERVEELAAVTFREIERLRRDGPTPDELTKVREMATRSRETDLRTNQFWINQLVSYDRHGWNLTDILAYPAWLQQDLRAERVRAAAVEFLNLDNYVRATLLPEDPR
jgi:zinc protease